MHRKGPFYFKRSHESNRQVGCRYGAGTGALLAPLHGALLYGALL